MSRQIVHKNKVFVELEFSDDTSYLFGVEDFTLSAKFIHTGRDDDYENGYYRHICKYPLDDITAKLLLRKLLDKFGLEISNE